MESLCIVGLDGHPVNVDISDAKTVPQLRFCVAAAIGKPARQVQLLDGTHTLEDVDELPVPESSITLVILTREPAWLPMNKYMHDGKEVLKITGSAVYGAARHSSHIHYIDGTSEKSDSYDAYDALVEEFGFVVHKSREEAPESGCEMFEAVPFEDPDEWETMGDPAYRGMGFHESGEKRKKK
jgi:hypothetical protein